MNKQPLIFPGVILTLLLHLAGLPTLAQGSEQYMGSYLITSYSSADYRAATQNWDMVQDSKGRILIANRDGVLVYDGFRWNLVTLPNPTPLRSLAIDENDRVYVGAVGQFGYLQPDSLGILQFISLSDSFTNPIGDVWETHVTNDGIVFATRTSIFLCEDEVCVRITPDFPMARSFYKHGMVLVSVPGKGVARLSGHSLDIFIEESEYGGGLIHSIVEAPALTSSHNDTGRYVYMFKRSGEAVYHNLDTGVSQSAEDALGFSYRIPPETYRINRLKNGGYVFATISSGIHLTDERLRVQEHINREAGLRVDMALNALEDRDGAIWGLLNNGISRIIDPSYVRFWGDDSGIVGTILHISSFRGDLVVSSSSGVFVIENNEPYLSPTRINYETAQMWQSETIYIDGRDYLLTAGNNDLFWWDGRNAGSLLTGSFRTIYQSRKTPGRIYYGTLQGWGYIDLRADNRGRLQMVNQVTYTDPPFEIGRIYEDENANIWLLARFHGVFLTRIPEDASQEPLIRSFTYDFANVSEESISMGMFYPNDILLFSGNLGLATADTVSMHFSQGHPGFDEKLNERTIMQVRSSGENKLVLLFDDGYGVAEKNDEGIWVLTYTSGTDAPDAPIYSLFTDDRYYWLGGAEGLFRYSNQNRPDRTRPFQAVIGEVVLGQDSLIYGGFLDNDHVLNLDYGRNQVRIEFGAARFHRYGQLRFESKLEGFDSDWTSKTSESRRIYTNIPDGRYVFRVRATDIYGVVSQEDTLAIHVATPWFKSWWAFFLYSISFAAFVIGLIRLRTRTILRRNRELELTIAKRTASLQVEKRRLEIINEDLKIQDEHREKFLSVVAHDLRNPLMIIRSSAELVEEDDISREEMLELTGFIRDASDRMQRIIETLLEDRAKKIRSAVGNGTRVNIAVLTNQVIREHKPWSDKKRITIVTSGIDPELYMQSDAAVAGVIIANLLSNAIKYSFEGSKVWISAEADDNSLKISVADEGQGLTSADIRDIGKPFKKLSARPTQGESSSGLGLHIVKELIEDLGGSLMAYSDGPGKGARFEVIFPNMSED